MFESLKVLLSQIHKSNVLAIKKVRTSGILFPGAGLPSSLQPLTSLDHSMHGIARQAAGDGLPPRATYIHAPTDRINHPLPRRTVNELTVAHSGKLKRPTVTKSTVNLNKHSKVFTMPIQGFL